MISKPRPLSYYASFRSLSNMLRPKRGRDSSPPFRSKASTSARSLPILAIGLIFSTLGLVADPAPDTGRPSVILAVSAPGEDGYNETFGQWAKSWTKAAQHGQARVEVVDKSAADLKQALEVEPKESTNPLWIALLGHGTFDGREPKFNLPGDDLKASDLAEWLSPFRRTVVVVCSFSASGAWLKPLSASNRVIVTATKSGSEINYSRFGGYFAIAIGDPGADLNKDGQTSVLEAWLSAAQKTADFYKTEGRLATEHSLLEDNGDGLGTLSNFYAGVRAVKKPAGAGHPDGSRAHQIHLIPSSEERELTAELREQRDKLELELARLRDQKAAFPDEVYFAKLEDVLLRIARLYQGEQPDSSSGESPRKRIRVINPPDKPATE